jgi:starch synthase
MHQIPFSMLLHIPSSHGIFSGIPLESTQFSELPLQIDTIVVSGMISISEASDFIEKVVTNRSIIQSAFSDFHHKPNTESITY